VHQSLLQQAVKDSDRSNQDDTKPTSAAPASAAADRSRRCWL